MRSPSLFLRCSRRRYAFTGRPRPGGRAATRAVTRSAGAFRSRPVRSGALAALLAGVILLWPDQAAAQQACVTVVSQAPYTVYAHAMNESRDWKNYRFAPDDQQRVCLQGQLFAGRQIEFVVKNFIAIPLDSCKATVGSTIRIQGRFLEEGGTRTVLQCS